MIVQLKPKFEARKFTAEDCWNSWLNKTPFWGFAISGSYHPGDRVIHSAYIYIHQNWPNEPVRCALGDWLVKDSKGVFQTLSNEDFEARFQSVDGFEAKYLEEKHIVDRIWNALEVFTYDGAGGKSIYELVAELKTRAEEAEAANEHDRTKLGMAIKKMVETLRGREWLASGRGCYEWDDDRWYKEFGAAMDEIHEALDGLRSIAMSFKNCPRDPAKIDAARAGIAKKAA